jgi:hypothetical protein
MCSDFAILYGEKRHHQGLGSIATVGAFYYLVANTGESLRACRL